MTMAERQMKKPSYYDDLILSVPDRLVPILGMRSITRRLTMTGVGVPNINSKTRFRDN